MKPFRTDQLTNRLLQLVPHSTMLAQFSLLLYFICPTLAHIGWLYMLVSALVVAGLLLSMGSLFALFRKDKLQLLNFFMNRNPKERIYDGMIAAVGLLIGLAYHDFAIIFIACITGFDVISSRFLPKNRNRW